MNYIATYGLRVGSQHARVTHPLGAELDHLVDVPGLPTILRDLRRRQRQLDRAAETNQLPNSRRLVMFSGAHTTLDNLHLAVRQADAKAVRHGGCNLHRGLSYEGSAS